MVKSEDVMIVGRTMWTQCTSVTDRQTDRQTDRRIDRITITKTVQRRASHGKNTGSATGSAWQQTGSAFALLCHNVAPPLDHTLRTTLYAIPR